MKKLIVVTICCAVAFSGFAQFQLTKSTTQKELQDLYSSDLTRTIELPVKYGNYDLANLGDMFTRVVVYNYLYEQLGIIDFEKRKIITDIAVTQSYLNKLLDGGDYEKPFDYQVSLDCGKVYQHDFFFFTTRPGYVVCTIKAGDYLKSGGFFQGYERKPIGMRSVYPFTDKDKKWAVEAFVNNYNNSEKLVRMLFDKPITLKHDISPEKLTKTLIAKKEAPYRKEGYSFFDYKKDEGDGVYALKGNEVVWIDFKNDEKKVIFTAPYDEEDESPIMAFNNNMFVVFKDTGDAVADDAVQFYWPNGELVYQCSTAQFDDDRRYISVQTLKDVTTKSKKTGKTTTTKKLVTMSCSYDAFPGGLVEPPATLKRGMKVNDALRLPGIQAKLVENNKVPMHPSNDLVLIYNGKRYRTNVYVSGRGDFGSPYEYGTWENDRWEEQMWADVVPSAFSDDAVVE